MMLQQALCTQEQLPAGGPGAFFLARAEEILPALQRDYSGRVQLIYLDPPFQTGDTFQMQINGNPISHPAYTDTLSDSQYLHMMRQVLEGCHALLHPTGSLYLHVDYRMSAQLRLMLDDIFGAKNFRNELIWAYQSGGRSKRHYPRKHDTILFYCKSPKGYFDIASVGYPRGADRRNHMKRSIGPDGRVCYSIRSGGKEYRYYEDSLTYPNDVWADIPHLHQRDPERTGYATQKPEALLRRVILASSRPGDLVADLFSGSGTTAAVACKTNRAFLAADCSPFALYSLRKRLGEAGAATQNASPASPVIFHFPANESRASLQATVERDGASLSCMLHAYHAPQKAGALIYCAFGYLHEGTFHPCTQQYLPSLPCTLRIPAGSAPALLHTIDMDGSQAFWNV